MWHGKNTKTFKRLHIDVGQNTNGNVWMTMRLGSMRKIEFSMRKVKENKFTLRIKVGMLGYVMF